LTSPTEPPPERVIVGTVGKPHGLGGTVVVHPDSDYPERFAPGSRLLTGDGTQLTVRSSHSTEKILLVEFAEVADRNDAESLRGTVLTIDAADRRPLRLGEYWPDDLVGLTVRDAHGKALGTVVDVDDSTVQHRLQIRTHFGMVEVPLVDDLVPVVEMADGYLIVAPIAGLFDREDEGPVSER
jgi:16S rRNA processing protein RimM